MPRKPARHVALLRGINLGAKNKVPMKTLAPMFEAAGCTEVRTYIQSGNVVYRAPAAVAKAIPAVIQAAIRDELGHDIPVLTRKAAEVLAVAEGNPFPTGDPETFKRLHVAFLQRKPTAAQVAALDPDRSPPDAFKVRGREVYLSFPNGTHKSRISVAYLDRTLGTVTSWRNWRTVLKLAEMVSE